MKRFLLLLLTFHCYLLSEAQVQWDKILEFGTDGYISLLVETSDQQYFAMSNYSFVKLNENGDSTYTSKRSGLPKYKYTFSSGATLPNGEIAIGGSTDQKAFIMVLDANGVVKKIKIYPNASITKALVANNGLVYAAFQSSSYALHGTNLTLDSLWSAYVASPDIPTNLIFDHKGNLVLLTENWKITDHSIYNGMAFKSPKKVISGSFYSRSIVPTFLQKNYNFFVSKEDRLIELSSGFDSLSSTFIKADRYFNFVTDTDGFSFLVSENPGWTFIQSSGTSSDSIFFPGLNDFKGTSKILKDKEGFYLFGGNAEYGGKFRIMKYKPKNIITSQIEENKEYRMVAFPNPAKNVLHLTPPNGISYFVLSNMVGDTFLETDVSSPIIQLDRDKIPSGLYIGQLNTENQESIQFKIILE